MSYKAPEVEGRSWPAREDLKWACPFCDGTRAERVGTGPWVTGEIALNVPAGHNTGSIEMRDVKCLGCDREFALTIQMSGMVGIEFKDHALWEQLKDPHSLAYSAADANDPTGWAGQN